MKKLIGAALVAILLSAAVVVIRAARLTPSDTAVPAYVEIAVDEAAAAARFAAALRYRTISFQPPIEPDTAEFFGLHRYFEDTYPLVHAQLRRETVGEPPLSLLYTWDGSDASKSPVVLMGHQDVVPVISGTEDEWTHGPFEGEQADGYVWGRGAMDDKVSVLAILEAVEMLLSQGYQPARTIYLAFGHDEELGGMNGARVIAELLKSRGASDYAMVIDEGGAIADGMVPGIDGPVAIVGIGEKGYLSLELTARAEGGHSSTPPSTTAIGILADAISKLEESPFPADLDAGGLLMIETVAPHMPFTQRLLFANRWLFDPLLERFFSGSPETSAMIRTTTAATMMSAGVKDNVLPIDATATVNFRILPGETTESVMDRVRSVVDDDRIEIAEWEGSGRDPSPLSDPASAAFATLRRTIAEINEDPVLIAPYLVMGGTDAKHYADASSNVFRFIPARFEEGDMGRVHGTNERLRVDSYANSIRFFVQLVKNADALP